MIMSILFLTAIILGSVAADNTDADWNVKQECWTKKSGVCVKDVEDFACPFYDATTWWKGCPTGYVCCVPKPDVVEHQPITSQQCGYRAYEESATSRVIGGFKAERGEFPWQVLIRYYGREHCGGVIISDRWIMTAAHCIYFYDHQMISVQTGFISLIRPERSQTPEIEHIIVHERFNKPAFANDVALIKLKQPIVFNNDSSAICIPRVNNEFLNQICTVSGWGWNGMENAKDLTAVNIPTMSYSQCKKAPKSGQYIYRQNLCAGFQAGERDACQGDSGGPLACRMSSGQWLLGGVVSWGEGCAMAEEPAVFARTTSFIDWIYDKTGLIWQ